MERTFVGLDVHARSVVACALDDRTGELSKARLVPDNETVLAWLQQLAGPVAVVYTREHGPAGSDLPRYPAYGSAFYEDQPIDEELDVSIVATLAEMTLDMLDTTAVAATALPAFAAPWRRACFDIYWDSPYVRQHWSVVRETYSSSCKRYCQSLIRHLRTLPTVT
jgi:hypothetical protein